MLVLLRYGGRGDGGYGSTCGEKMLTGKRNAEATHLGELAPRLKDNINPYPANVENKVS